jgi:alpha-1,6-mannosyltransferase
MATIIVAISAYTSWSSNIIQFWVLCSASLVLAGLSAWIAFSKHFDSLTLRRVILTAILLCLAGLLSSPIMEDDHFRFLWDGYITATTGRPYQHAPSFYFDKSNVPEYFQTLLNGINNPDVRTVYGPLLQAVFAVAYVVAPGELWPLKAMLAGALVSILLMASKAGVHPKWLMIFLIHPLLVKESILTAHPDLFIGAFVLSATLLWRREFYKWAIIAIAAACAIKISTLAILPVFCFDRRGKFCWPVLFSGTVAVCLLHLPMIAERVVGAATGIADFGNQWVFNPTLFRGFAFMLGDANARVTVVIVFALILLRILFARRKQGSIEAAIIGTFGVLFLLSPVVNPWYWLWVLPLAFFSNVTAISLWLASAVSLLAYVHILNVQLNSQQYVVPHWVSAFQLLATLLLLIGCRKGYRDEYSLDASHKTFSP